MGVFRALALTGVMLLVISASFGAGVLASPSVRAQVAAAPTPPADLVQQLAPLYQAWSLVEEHFVFRDNVDRQRMVQGAIQGALATLDDEGHTRFLSPIETKMQESSLRGRFEGIGAEMTTRNGRPTVVAPIEGSPAERAGVRPGDVILAVDGVEVGGLSLAELVSLVRGPKGTTVRLRVLHPRQSAPTELTIVREEIRSPMVSWALVPETKVAHIRVSQFGRTAHGELRQALREARRAGAEALIVDVRNNPGGLLDQAIAITSEFDDQGIVLQQEDREGRRKSYPANKGGLALDLPLVVLVNEGSASAAEIFAGALQDNGRAKVLGTRTFGTGTVLSTFPLSDGSSILLGTGQWLTPAGRAIRKRGIRPDVELVLAPDAQIVSPRALRTLSAAELRQQGDTPLLRALATVESRQTAPPVTLRSRPSPAYAY